MDLNPNIPAVAFLKQCPYPRFDRSTVIVLSVCDRRLVCKVEPYERRRCSADDLGMQFRGCAFNQLCDICGASGGFGTDGGRSSADIMWVPKIMICCPAGRWPSRSSPHRRKDYTPHAGQSR